mmetsp:Transcript_25916/g.30538  ORF Transcript_25916/g.30538 Transcript_25916/m.30538 type:complete len:90 (-) Transcript_25916:735-1004(-)
MVTCTSYCLCDGYTDKLFASGTHEFTISPNSEGVWKYGPIWCNSGMAAHNVFNKVPHACVLFAIPEVSPGGHEKRGPRKEDKEKLKSTC